MKDIFNKKNMGLALSITLGLAGGGLFIFLLFNIFNLVGLFQTVIRLMSPIIMGFFLAYLLAPLLNSIEHGLILPMAKKTPEDLKGDQHLSKVVRVLSTLLTLLIFMAALAVLLNMIVPEVIKSIQLLSGRISSYVTRLNEWTARMLKGTGELERVVTENLNNAGDSMQVWLKENVIQHAGQTIAIITGHLVNLIRFCLEVIVALIVSVYVLYSKEDFVAQGAKIICTVFERKRARRIMKDIGFIHKTFGGFIVGKIVDSIIIGLICFAACSVLQMPYTILVSVFVGVTNVIPFVGPFIGAIPSGFLILVEDPKKCLYFAIMILVLQQLDGNVIGPKILGDSTGLSAFWVIFAITLFGGLFGLAGMFLGVPLFAVFYNMFRRFCNRKLWFKHLPQDTRLYRDPDSIFRSARIYRVKRAAVKETGTEKAPKAELVRKTWRKTGAEIAGKSKDKE